MRTRKASGLCRGGRRSTCGRAGGSLDDRLELGAVRPAPGGNVEGAGRNPEPPLEAPGEIGRRGKAAGQRNRGQRRRARVREEPQRLLQAKPLHEIGRRRADERLEHAVEVERREQRDPRQIPQPEWFVEVADDVVDGAVDPLDVRQGRGRSCSLGDSQDLASPPRLGRYHRPACPSPN